MNRKLIFIAMSVLSVVLILACSGKKEEAVGHDHQVSDESWKEMDEFHMIMAEAFHPFKDSVNLEPAKLNANALAASAAKWATSTLPEKVNNDEMKSKLEELKVQTAAFVETVGKGDDKIIGEELTRLHDLFHTIQESWYGGHGDHHH